jgi:hypothetical protein
LEETILPDTLKKVDKNAFLGCSSMMGIRVPDSVDEIAAYAFGYDYDEELANDIQANMESYAELGEDVIQVKSNEIAFPVVDNEGNEKSIVVVVKVPTGANKGTEPYDPYSMGEEFQMKEQAKLEKAKEKAKLKAEKIAKDTLRREKEKAIKEKREGVKA